MKKVLLLIFFAAGVIGLNAQSTRYATKWLITKPFERNVFIENKGQFPDYQLKDIKDNVLYYTVKGKLKVYYAPDGIIFEHDTIVKTTGEEKLKNGYEDNEGNDEDGKKNLRMERNFVKMQWDGGNANPQVEVQNPVRDYFTYSNPNDKTGKSGIKAHGFGKLIYRNVYKGIDVVFYYPEEKGGLEYDVIVHPGADISTFKMHYSGATALLDNGLLKMSTPYGVSFTDHSPEGTDGDGDKVSTVFKLENNTASFEVGKYDKSKTLTIDPWLTATAFTGVNKAFDLDYDVNGNVYIYGGGATVEYQVKKYDNTGTLQWTYIGTMPYIYSGAYFYGGMVADERTGTTYLCEGFDPSPGSNVIKINSSGIQVSKYVGGSGIDEMWHMAFDYCNNHLLYDVGGGSSNAAYSDTNVTTVKGVNIFGAGTQDQTLICTDGGSNCYVGSCQMVFSSVKPNYLAQCVLPTLSPIPFSVYDKHGFIEITNINYYPLVGGYSGGNGFNGLAANSKIAVTYDGGTGRIWRASNGTLIDSVKPSATHYTWGGLDLDCKSNIYCGNNNSISVYDSSANPVGTIPLSGTVYALRWDPRGLVYACGNGFVQAVTAYAKLASVAVVQPVGCSCTGSITANACGVGPFSYSWSNGATSSSLTGLCAGAYTVTINSSGCFPRQDTAMATITGNPGYSATLIDTNPDCGFKKGNITVVATGGVTPYTYNWSDGSTNQKDTGLGAGTYTVTVTDNAGCKYTISTTLINPTSPIIKISPSPDTLCQGFSVLLTASGAKTYTWNPGALIGTSVLVSPLTTTIYTVTGVDSNGCTGSATVNIVVNSPPAITVAPLPDSVCSGNGVTITASGASTYTWSPAAGLSCLNCANPLASPTVTTTYTVVGKDKHGCIDSTTVQVVVKPKPIPTITVTPASDTICNGDSAMLVAGGGGSYIWTFSGSPKDTIWVKPATSTIYTLQVTLNGCVATANKSIIVIGAVIPKIVVAKDSLCQGDSTTITASGGTAYKWLIPGNPTSATITVKPNSNTTYSVVVTTPCGKDTLVSKLIHVFPYPVITSSGNTSICRGSSATISAGGGASYVWSNGATTTSINVNPASTKTYTVTVSNGMCVKDTTITVTVDTPAVLTITPNQKICIGDSTTLTATGGPSYKWSNGATTSSISVKPGANTTYTCVVDKNGCVDSTTTTVTVDIPVLNVCCDKTIMPGGADTIIASGALSYIWVPNNNISCVTVSCDTIIATPGVTTTYVVTAKDAAGCTVSKQVTVLVEIPCADFTVPNIFTPNNDGRNDDFVINILNPSTYSIVIYDRWGKEVYTSTDPTVYWNGKVMGTQYLVSDGVYYYIIKATCGNNDYVKKGFVQVVGEQ